MASQVVHANVQAENIKQFIITSNYIIAENVAENVRVLSGAIAQWLELLLCNPFVLVDRGSKLPRSFSLSISLSFFLERMGEGGGVDYREYLFYTDVYERKMRAFRSTDITRITVLLYLRFIYLYLEG